MLLGFIIFERGIKANPEKISAITNMALIQNLKGGTKAHGVPGIPQPLHFMPR
jgi:hypothetical protein